MVGLVVMVGCVGGGIASCIGSVPPSSHPARHRHSRAPCAVIVSKARVFVVFVVPLQTKPRPSNQEQEQSNQEQEQSNQEQEQEQEH
jgi:hypothetical protein